MILYHSTDDSGKRGIEAQGFARDDRDGSGTAWFSASKPTDGWTSTSRRDWWVIVDIPDEVAEPYHYHFADGEPYLDNYALPWAVVNRYGPFRYERWS